MIPGGYPQVNNNFGASGDPALRFSDPVAMQTRWEPIGTSSANFRTHKLVKIKKERMDLRTTIGQLLFSLIFLVVGLCFVLLVGFSEIIPFLLGAVFAVLGLFMLISNTIPYVFDREAGLYFKGRKPPKEMSQPDNFKLVNLNHIYAIQLLPRYVHNSNGSYYTYELNLVLFDGKRIGILSYGHRRAMREDAQKLAEFLNKPLWDAID